VRQLPWDVGRGARDSVALGVALVPIGVTFGCFGFATPAIFIAFLVGPCGTAPA
jgi:hypothetical protein